MNLIYLSEIDLVGNGVEMSHRWIRIHLIYLKLVFQLITVAKILEISTRDK